MPECALCKVNVNVPREYFTGKFEAFLGTPSHQNTIVLTGICEDCKLYLQRLLITLMYNKKPELEDCK